MSEVIVGKYQGEYLTAKGQQFILLAAPTGSEKGVACVLPNLLNYSDSVVVFDLKLENFRFTSAYRARHGQTVFLFAPFAEDRHTHRWNMLDAVSSDPLLRVGDILAVGQVFYPSDCDPREKFWNDNARNLFLAFVLLLLETPTLPRTMGEVFRQSSGKGKQLKDHIEGCIAARAAGGNPLSEDCVGAFARFLSAPENTLGNIITTFNAPLLVFANPLVDAATSGSDFDVHQLRKQRLSIYVGIQPTNLGEAALLVNMLFSQIISLNTRDLPENDPALRYECLLILDEFAALGKVGIIAKANAYIRGYNIRLLTVIQSISQLEAVYGAAETRTLVVNHALQIVYPPGDQKEAKEYSEMLGYYTVKSVSTGESRPRAFGHSGSSSESTSDQRRALMLPQELTEMARDKQIVKLQNTKPILCEKARYFEDQRFIDRLKEVSPFLSALDQPPSTSGRLNWWGLWRRKVRPTEAQLKHAAFVLKELSATVPQLAVPVRTSNDGRTTRALREGEPVDLSLLAFDVNELPSFDGAEVPTPEAAAKVVDAMFRLLGVSENPDPGDLFADATDAATGEPEGFTPNMIEEYPDAEVSENTAPAGEAIDLSVLDH